ncbi:TonB-dependent receptor plug domain-containing protein [Azonexus sp. IMCC34839]|uniref:TonB-dependent receptor plug domain-containing protein n=1 Tax=Azonexus sp. IMCC34839 TaxID=3133695 RepID=UPI00399B2B97
MPKQPTLSKPKVHRLLLAIMLAVSGTSGASFDAIDIPLEDLSQVKIISTPKFAENPDQIPSLVSILTADDIRIYGWRTLSDALRSLQGINVTDDHTYAYTSVRGISQAGDYRARMQVLIDGIATNENIYGSAPTGSEFPLDLGLVERIEIIRGPSASVYGSDSMFGVINVVTRSGQSLRGGEAALSLGSGKAYRLRSSFGGNVGGNDLLVSFTGYDSSGRSLVFNDTDASGEAQRLHAIGAEQGGQLFVRARGSDWRVTLVHSQRDRTIPTASYATIADDKGHTEADRYSLFDLGKDWQINAKNTLQQRLYASEYGYDGKFPYDYSASGGASRLFNVDRARGNAWGLENRLINTAWDKQRWTLGLEYRANSRQDQKNYDRGVGCYDSSTGNSSTSACLDDRHSSHVFTVYAQDEIQLGTANTLIIGLRHDRVSDSKNFWSPRLGLIHEAGDLGLFKLLYGTAFRTPSPYERAYITPSYSYGNPDIGPERLKSVEFTWEKRLANLGKLTASAYSMRIEDLVTTNPDTGTVINGSPVRANGIEIGYEQRWKNGLQVRGSLSSQYAASDSGRLDNSPRHMAKLNLGMPTGITGLMAGLESQWIGDRRANNGNERVAPYLLTNLNFSYLPAGNRWEMGLGIYNLFDRRYTDPVSPDEPVTGVTRWSMPQLGRTVQLRTLIRF